MGRTIWVWVIKTPCSGVLFYLCIYFISSTSGKYDLYRAKMIAKPFDLKLKKTTNKNRINGQAFCAVWV
jgi:hypothetical protein